MDKETWAEFSEQFQEAFGKKKRKTNKAKIAADNMQNDENDPKASQSKSDIVDQNPFGNVSGN